MRRRTIVILGVAILVAAVVALIVVLRRNAPPEAARLLPEADAVFYINVGMLRRAGVFSRMQGSMQEPEYLEFVRKTGFQFERDLDEAAFAVHTAQPSPSAPRTSNDDYPRFSEVFIGKFDSDRGTAYFRTLATQTEQYRDATIYNIPHEGRTVRVALLGADIAAISNTESSDPIHTIIDRYRRVALPFSGPSMLATHYRHVPFASLAWLITRIVSASTTPGDAGPGLRSPAWLRDVAGGSTLVASLRFIGVLQLRMEAFADDAGRARQIAENANAFLSLFRSVESSVQVSGTDPDVKAVLASIVVQHDGSSAVLKADVPIGLLKKIATDAPSQVTAPTAPTEPPPAAKSAKPSRKKH
jgi:hypothetical protein